MLARLANCPAPAQNTLLRYTLTFNGVTGLRIAQQQKRGSPRQKIVRYCGNRLVRPAGKVVLCKLFEFFGPENHGAETGSTGQIIPYPVPR